MEELNFTELTAKELYSEDVICRIMDEPDPILRKQLEYNLLDRASEFGEKIEKRVKDMLKIAEKDMLQRAKERKKSDSEYERYTDFGGKYPDMKCGNWKADKWGVYNPDAIPADRMACPHPILPAEIITNVEDGTQKVRLAFCRSGRWVEQIVPKTIIANKSKIPELAGIGVAVTSESARNLVRYLAEVEQLNLESIPEVRATAKMGWCEDGFMPYTSSLSFDKDGRFDSLYSTISSAGSRQKWMDFVLSIRASGRIEPRLVMAASLASVLVKPCGLLPFWVDIWGKTGGGKSVCGMLAASVWADPEIGKYISKFDSTVAAFEANAGFLNNLPFVIDDTAEIRRRMKDDFSQLIYQLSSGEGKSRSNTKLGLAQKTTWANTIICSGESPIITEQLQGGAINRVLEYEVDEGDIFPDGQAAAGLLRNNYGFMGKEFIELIEVIGLDKISEMQKNCFKAIKNNNYEDKQLLSLSLVLTADKIATEYFFRDNKALSFSELEKILTDKDAMSENERCYEYIINECAVNDNKFSTNAYAEYVNEIWGKYFSEGPEKISCVAIVANVFKRMCNNGGFSSKAFTAWALKKGIMLGDSSGKSTKVVKFFGQKNIRCYVLKMPNELETDNEIPEQKVTQ